MAGTTPHGVDDGLKSTVVAGDESQTTIHSAPKEGQLVSHNGKTFTTIREGLAYILVPQNARTLLDPKKTIKGEEEEAQSVFYNPIQQFNRDLSVLAIRAYGEDLIATRQQAKETARGRKRKRKTIDEVAQPAKVRNDGCGDETIRDERVKDVEKNATLPEEQVSSTTIETAVIENDGEGVSLALKETVETDPISKHDDAEREEKPAQVNGQRSPKFKILDALSATGLRAIRYAHEIPFVTSVTANDLAQEAVDSINANVIHNKLDGKIETVTGNAMSHMYTFVGMPGEKKSKNKYDVIDLDPYGTAAYFLDGAVQAINDGGLLMVTCTDPGVWASCGYPEKCYSLYGGTPIKGLHSHEGGLRLILHAIAASAARYGMSIEPLLSLSIDYYARVFVRVFQSPAEVKMLAGKTMLVYNCDHGCGAWTTQFLVRNAPQGDKGGQFQFKHSLAQGPTASTFCQHCSSKTHLSGPMWGGPLHNAKFIDAILSQVPTLDTKVYGTTHRLEGMLTTALEELLEEVEDKSETQQAKPAASDRLIPKVDASRVDRNPFYFVPSALAKVIHARAPAEAEVRGALRHAGYAVTRSHARAGTIKTNAPWEFIWRMMREWVLQKAPIKEDSLKKGSPGWAIMFGGGARGSTTAGAQSTDTVMDDSTMKPEIEGDLVEAGAAEAKDGGAVEPAEKKVVFNAQLGAEANKKRLRRYQENPRANWGPMNRAKNRSPVRT